MLLKEFGDLNGDNICEIEGISTERLEITKDQRKFFKDLMNGVTTEKKSKNDDASADELDKMHVIHDDGFGNHYWIHVDGSVWFTQHDGLTNKMSKVLYRDYDSIVDMIKKMIKDLNKK